MNLLNIFKTYKNKKKMNLDWLVYVGVSVLVVVVIWGLALFAAKYMKD